MKMKPLCHAIMLALGLLLMMGCSAINTTPQTAQTQQIETACAAASAGIKSLTIAQAAGALNNADRAAVNSAIQIVQPICAGPVAPSYNSVAVAALNTAVVELASLETKYKTPGE
jgi:hypothetical protein